MIPEQIALPVVKEIFFKLLGKVSVRLQKKFFPFDLKKLVIEFNSTPQISLYYSRNSCTLEFYLQIKNFTGYKLKIMGAQCDIILNGYGFTEVSSNYFQEIVPSNESSYKFIKRLTYFEAKNAEELFKKEVLAQADFKFNFIVKSIYQEQNYSVDKRHDIKLIIGKQKNIKKQSAKRK